MIVLGRIFTICQKNINMTLIKLKGNNMPIFQTRDKRTEPIASICANSFQPFLLLLNLPSLFNNLAIHISPLNCIL